MISGFVGLKRDGRLQGLGAEALLGVLVLSQSAGTTAVLPLLPLYARSHGADLGFLGLMVGAFMAANLVSLYPAGWLSDRLGRRRLMATGLVLYALSAVGFLCFQTPWAFVMLRALEGIGASCFMPAALAYVADRVPDVERGVHIARLTVAQNLGMLAGPAVGGAIASAWGVQLPLVALGAIALGCTVLTARLPALAPRRADSPDAKVPAPWQDVRWGALWGLATRSFAGGYAFGMYEAVWSIYMSTLGASLWQISLSWALFAIPSILLARLAGRLIDRFGVRPALVLGTLFSAVIVLGYALSRHVEGLLCLSVLDGIGFAFSYPAQNAAMVALAPDVLRGRVIGMVTMIGTLGSLVGALFVPPLFKLAPLWGFGSAALLLLVSAIVMASAMSRHPSTDMRRVGGVSP